MALYNRTTLIRVESRSPPGRERVLVLDVEMTTVFSSVALGWEYAHMRNTDHSTTAEGTYSGCTEPHSYCVNRTGLVRRGQPNWEVVCQDHLRSFNRRTGESRDASGEFRVVVVLT